MNLTHALDQGTLIRLWTHGLMTNEQATHRNMSILNYPYVATEIVNPCNFPKWEEISSAYNI